MHTTTSNLLAAAAAATCGQGSDCRNNAHSVTEEHLVAQNPQVEEAGSIVLQFSRSWSVFKNESKEMQGTTSAAAKKKVECVDKDAEILRLIEERRKMPKEERHRLKELSKTNVSEKKKSEKTS